MIINQYDLAQINEGIKRQKGTNINFNPYEYETNKEKSKRNDKDKIKSLRMKSNDEFKTEIRGKNFFK